MIKKPLSYRIYDYTKGGIDIPDQRIRSYKIKKKMDISCIIIRA